MNILLLDNDESIHHYIRLILGNKHKIFHCYDLAEAKEVIKEHHLELALIDYYLNNNEKGFNIISDLNKLTSSCLMTANSSEEMLEEAFQKKTSFLLKKPFSQDQLKKIVVKAEEKHKATMHSQILIHELMSPLFSLQGKIDINRVKEVKNIDINYEEEYHKISKQVQNMLNLVNYFNKHKTNEKDINLLEFFSEIKSDCLLMKDRNFSEKQLNISGDNLSVSKINTTILKHSIINLIKNSYDSDSNSKIDLDCFLTDSDVVISIKDDGSGIPEENQDKIFIPNYTSKDFGMGVGLFFSKESLKEMGLNLSLKDSSNKGSEFQISIPLSFLIEK